MHQLTPASIRTRRPRRTRLIGKRTVPCRPYRAPILTFYFILPILWMTSASFQSGEKMFKLTTEWIPAVWHFENYPNALSRAAFPTYFFNSGVISVAVMVSNVVFCTLADTASPSSGSRVTSWCCWQSSRH